MSVKHIVIHQMPAPDNRHIQSLSCASNRSMAGGADLAIIRSERINDRLECKPVRDGASIAKHASKLSPRELVSLQSLSSSFGLWHVSNVREDHIFVRRLQRWHGSPSDQFWDRTLCSTIMTPEWDESCEGASSRHYLQLSSQAHPHEPWPSSAHHKGRRNPCQSGLTLFQPLQMDR